MIGSSGVSRYVRNYQVCNNKPRRSGITGPGNVIDCVAAVNEANYSQPVDTKPRLRWKNNTSANRYSVYRYPPIPSLVDVSQGKIRVAPGYLLFLFIISILGYAVFMQSSVVSVRIPINFQTSRAMWCLRSVRNFASCFFSFLYA